MSCPMFSDCFQSLIFTRVSKLPRAQGINGRCQESKKNLPRIPVKGHACTPGSSRRLAHENACMACVYDPTMLLGWGDGTHLHRLAPFEVLILREPHVKSAHVNGAKASVGRRGEAGARGCILLGAALISAENGSKFLRVSRLERRYTVERRGGYPLNGLPWMARVRPSFSRRSMMQLVLAAEVEGGGGRKGARTLLQTFDKVKKSVCPCLPCVLLFSSPPLFQPVTWSMMSLCR